MSMPSNIYQPLDPQSAPDPVTPQASPADPAGYAMVTPHGQGPAPYDIQADLGAGQAEIQAAFSGAGVSAGEENAVYPAGPRQAEARTLLESPQGFSAGSGTSGYDILAGWSGDGDGDFGWANDTQPGALLNTPIQGQPDYPVSNTQ